MPRDSSGTYTLPSGNPVVSGTVIESVWANDTTSDLAVQMNNLLTRDGLLGPIQPMLFVNGTEALPGIAFALSPSTGLFRFAPNNIGLSIGGVAQQAWSASGSAVTNNFAVGGTLSVVGGMSISGSISVVGTDPGTLGYFAQNTSVGTSSTAGIVARNDISTIAELVVTSSTFSAFPLAGVSAGLLYADGPGGWAIGAVNAAGSIRFSAGGSTEQMRLSAAGFLGIGTTPGAALHVLAVANQVTRFSSSAANGGYVGLMTGSTLRARIGNGSNVITGAGLADLCLRSDAGAVLFSANGAVEHMRLSTAGNLAVGNTTASNKFSVGAPTDALNNASVHCSATGAARFYADCNGNMAISIGTNFTGSTDTFGMPTGSGGIGTVGVWPVVFTCNGAERMRIDTTGQVGIGGTPTEKFHVWNGDVAMTSSFGGAGSTPSSRNLLVSAINSFSNQVAHAGLQVRFTRLGADTDYGSDLLLYTAADNTTIERMRIDRLGNVGIGTASPQTKLHVTGAASATILNALTLQNTDNSASGQGTQITFKNSSYAGVEAAKYGFIRYFALGTFGEAGAMTFGTNLGSGVAPVERMRIDHFGNVGIGTGGSSIVGNLNVRQDSGDGPNFVLENRAVNGATHRYGALIFSPFRDIADPVYGAAVWAEGASAAGYSADLCFGASTNAGTSVFPTEMMRIDNAALISKVVGGTRYNLANDPGPTAASIPIGSIVQGTATGAGYTGLAALATIALSGANTITLNGFSGLTTVLSSGTYRLISRITGQECIFIRTA